jgi:hypothetical protein
MTTREAFESLIKQPAWYKLCNVHPDTARSIKYQYKKNKVSIDAMEKMIKAAGGKKVPEKWSMPFKAN